jgi:hypothetical protein
VSFEVIGDYTGTFLSNGAFDLQAAATKNADGSGGNVFAVSQTVDDSMTTPTVPEPSSLLLLGSGLLGLAVLFRNRLMPLRRTLENQMGRKALYAPQQNSPPRQAKVICQ